MIPIEAKTKKQIYKLDDVAVVSGNFRLYLEPGGVWLDEYLEEKGQIQEIRIPRRNFDALVRWYTTGRKGKRK